MPYGAGLDGLFAAINGSYRRDAGDAVLAAWGRVLQANAPDGSSVVRLGGDEFAVALPGNSAETSRTEASLLREALDDLLYKHRDTL